MFTGIIQSVGSIERRGQKLLVKGCGAFLPIKLGDSIAVDGVCLTAREIVDDGFLADVSEETLSRTTLGEKSENTHTVNLEPAIRFSDRLGGHLVSGHVDGLGEIFSIQDFHGSWRVDIAWRDENYSKYIVEKSSIAVNGISLTVAGFEEEGRKFWIAVIPHTWQETSLKSLKIGNLVNLEADLIAKYTERLLIGQKSFSKEDTNNKTQSISSDWLRCNGWM